MSEAVSVRSRIRRISIFLSEFLLTRLGRVLVAEVCMLACWTGRHATAHDPWLAGQTLTEPRARLTLTIARPTCHSSSLNRPRNYCSCELAHGPQTSWRVCAGRCCRGLWGVWAVLWPGLHHKVQTHQVRSLILIADGAARVLPARPEARAGGARGQRCSRACRPAVVQEQCRPRPRSIQIRPD